MIFWILIFIFGFIASFSIALSFYKIHTQAFETFSQKDKERVASSRYSTDRYKFFLAELIAKFINPEKNLFLKSVARKLVTANLRMNIMEFLIMQIVTAFIFFSIGIILFGIANPAMTIFIGILGFFAPSLWLNNAAKARQNKVNKDLPLVVDILALCVSAGSDFMLAISRVVRDFKPGPITEELSLVLQQVNMGKPRADALKQLAWRLDMPEIYSFVRVLLQAERMGTPIADALKILSEDVRIRRFQRGEAQALKAPLKLLIPLIFFILPVVFIIIAGPILIRFLKSGLQF